MIDHAPTRTLEKALVLLNFLGEQRRELGVAEIARHLDMSPSTTYRLLRTLAHHKFVKQNPETMKYRLDIKLIELGNMFLESIELRAIARPVLVRLMEVSRETVHLMVLDGDMGVYLDRVESPQRVRVTSNLGRREHLHCSAVGKAILAHLPHETVAQIIRTRGLPRFTANTITDPVALALHLERARRLGYTIDDVEGEEGVRCVGAPVFGHTGVVVASISVSGPAYRLSLEKLKRLSRAVKAAAQEISAALGYSAVPRPSLERLGIADGPSIRRRGRYAREALR
jgi:DNA-binding IclR family transcriptional regulator